MNFNKIKSAVSSTFESAADTISINAEQAWLHTQCFAQDAGHAVRMAGISVKHGAQCVGRATVSGAKRTGRVAVAMGVVTYEIIRDAVILAAKAVWWVIMLPINIVFAIFFAIYTACVLASVSKAFQGMADDDARFAAATVVN